MSPEEQISCDILRWECEVHLEGLEFPTHLTPINQFESLHLIIGQFASGRSAQPFATVKDYENWIERLDGFIAWCDTAIPNMRQGMAAGHMLPKALTEKAILQMADLSRGSVENHIFYSPAKNSGSTPIPTSTSVCSAPRCTVPSAGWWMLASM